MGARLQLRYGDIPLRRYFLDAVCVALLGLLLHTAIIIISHWIPRPLNGHVRLCLSLSTVDLIASGANAILLLWSYQKRSEVYCGFGRQREAFAGLLAAIVGNSAHEYDAGERLPCNDDRLRALLCGHSTSLRAAEANTPAHQHALRRMQCLCSRCVRFYFVSLTNAFLYAAKALYTCRPVTAGRTASRACRPTPSTGRSTWTYSLCPFLSRSSRIRSCWRVCACANVATACC